MKSFLKERTRFTIYSNLLITLLCTGSLFNGYYPVKIDNEETHANAREIVDTDLEPLSEEALQGNRKKKSVTLVSSRAEVKSSNKTSSSKKTSTGNYVPAKYSSVTGDAIVNYAKRYIGLKYVHAGRSLATGTDCSGFTSLIFREFGVKLGYTVQSQVKSGSYIRKSDLQKGDLVFYGYHGRASHVAIYIGNGKVIHESTYKYGVKISPLNMMPYITARRVINAKAIAKVENEVKKEEKQVVKEETVVGDVKDATSTANTNTVTENNVVKEDNLTNTQTTETVNNQVDNSSSKEETPQVSTNDTSKEIVQEQVKEEENKPVQEPAKEEHKQEVVEESKKEEVKEVPTENSVNTETE